MFFKKKGGIVPDKSKALSKSTTQPQTITLEKIWSLRNIQIALFIGFILLIIDVATLFLLNADIKTSLIIILLSVIIYAIVLYFLLNPPSQRTIEKDRVRQIETPTIKIIEKPIEKPIVKIVEKPIERIKYIEKPLLRQINRPISVPVRSDPMKDYSFVVSKKTGIIHPTDSTAGRMIKPENREFANEIKHLIAKGYTPHVPKKTQKNKPKRTQSNKRSSNKHTKKKQLSKKK
jgi:hypothetical protein